MKKRKTRRSNFSIGFIYFITVFAILAVVGTISYFVLSNFFLKNDFSQEKDVPKEIQYSPTQSSSRTILFINEDNEKLQSLMLVRIQPVAAQISCIPVPITTISKVNTKKATLKDFYDKNGQPELCDAIKNVFGIPVERYVILDNFAFNQFVRKIGGIVFPVPFDMYYENPETNEITNFKCNDKTTIFYGDDLRKIMTYP